MVGDSIGSQAGAGTLLCACQEGTPLTHACLKSRPFYGLRKRDFLAILYKQVFSSMNCCFIGVALLIVYENVVF